MEKEWSSILFNVLPYKETDTYILKSPDEASQLLDDHIVMTQSMSFSPYKKPFEQRINSWETKLKLTQVGLPPFVLPSKGVLSTRWHLL
jgi:dynein heavy chain